MSCFQLIVEFDVGVVDLAILEIHERGQSSLYFGKDYSKEFDYFIRQTHTLKTLEMKYVQKMKLSRYVCDESNSKMFVNCINEYYEERLKCNLPWTNFKKSKNLQKTCTSDKDYDEFLNISKSLVTSQVKKEIEKKGCFIPNCAQKFWKVKTSIEIPSLVKGNKTSIVYLMPAKAKVPSRTEVPLYTFSTFFAEVGGYLGLLVGESLISFYERFQHFFSKFRKQKH